MTQTRQIKHTLRYKADAMLRAATKAALPAAMAVPPTMSISAHNANTTISGGVYVSVTSDSGSHFSFTGSQPRLTQTGVGGNAWNAYSGVVDMMYPGGVTRTGGTFLGNAMRARFYYGGRYLELLVSRIVTGISGAYRVWVDGSPTAMTPRLDLDPTSKSQRIIIDFGSADVRLVEFEMEQGIRFGGVCREANYDVWAAPTLGPRLLGIGDSFFEGIGADYFMSSLFRRAADRLGIVDAWNQGEGGLGYLGDGTQSLMTARQKLAFDVVPYQPDWIVVGLGANDGPLPAGAVEAEVGLFFGELLAAVPYAGITVIGPWRSPGLPTPSAIFAAVRNAVLSQADAVGSGRLRYFDTQVENWQQVAGRIGATSGIGNSNVYIGSDNAHLAQAGHDYMGARVADAVHRHLLSAIA